MNVMFAMK